MQNRFKFRAWDKENKKYVYNIEKGLEFHSTARNLRVMTLADFEKYAVIGNIHENPESSLLKTEK